MTPVSLAALVVAAAALVVALVALLRSRSTHRLAAQPSPPVEPPSADDLDWELQWIEPGVYFLANASPRTVAFQVEVSSSLTPVSGGAATTAMVREQRVNPGAWIEVRHAGIEQQVLDDLQQLRRSSALTEQLRGLPGTLDEDEAAALADADAMVYELQDRVEYTLSYNITWRTGSGSPRHKAPLEQRLVPSPSGV